MALVGDIMAELNKERFIPVIGIATWGILRESQQLMGVGTARQEGSTAHPLRSTKLPGSRCGVGFLLPALISAPIAGLQRTLEQRLDVPYEHQQFDSLDAAHNCFLLVDDGSQGKFGVEIPFRAKFEEASVEWDHSSLLARSVEHCCGGGTVSCHLVGA
jgi:hypothetical protein